MKKFKPNYNDFLDDDHEDPTWNLIRSSQGFKKIKNDLDKMIKSNRKYDKFSRDQEVD